MVEERLKQELEVEAQEKGARPSDILRQAIEEHLRQRTPRPSCLDIARRIGFIGAYPETPDDLSTNPKHREGFGVA